MEKRIITYLENPKMCKHCNSILHFDIKSHNFCNQSCAAIYNNKNKDYSVIKSGPDKGYVPKNYAPSTKIKQCVICGKFHPRKAATCSKSCCSIHISNSVRGKTGGNTDPNIEYYDSFNNHCFLDSTWELILANSLEKNNIIWQRPKRFIFSDGRSYTPDFYLPEYNLYLDPKGLRAGYYRDSKLKVQKFEFESGNKCLIITQEKFLTWGHIQTALLLDLHWS
jgi:hypothetical protein